jgi:predicted lipoprotein with Yx(FWY)xxD motif
MSIAILLALASAAPEVPATSVQAVQEGSSWVMRNLIDDNLLYTFDQDEPGKSNCNDTCSATYRPLTVFGSDRPIGKWTPITRADGSSQWAYDGKPVYSIAQVPEPMTASNGKLGNWHPLTMPAQ